MAAPFFEVILTDLTVSPTKNGLSVGYEDGSWRTDQFADYMMKWLPEFSLTYSDYGEGIPAEEIVNAIRRAASQVYKTKKFQNRGEFGELILHAALREVFKTKPAISKIFYKSAHNDTVKGFDAVHVVEAKGELELWLGEAKIYKDPKQAIASVAKELIQHTEIDYLKDEFALLINKVDVGLPFSEKLKLLLDPSTSLDKVFSTACIPVLIAYNSDCVQKHKEDCDAYRQEFSTEASNLYDFFLSKKLPKKFKIHLILVPVEDKFKLLKALNKKLDAWKNI